MAGVALVNPKIPFYDALGAPLVGGTLDVFLAGTTTRTNTWQDKAQTTLNTNPIVLDARGECTLWADDTLTYKFVLKNSAGVQQWAEDNISGANVAGTLVTFTQAGTGAVSRTGQAKMREWVTVEDFGAVGDGVTNDTTAINNALASGAKRVLLGENKTYLHSADIIVKTGQIFQGAGWTSVLKHTSGLMTDGAVVVKGTVGTHVADVVVRDMKIEGSSSSVGAFDSTDKGVYIKYADRVLVENVHVTKAAGEALYMTADGSGVTSFVTFRNNRVTNSAHNAYNCNGAVDSALVINNTAKDIGNFLFEGSGSDAIVMGNYVDTYAGSAGITVGSWNSNAGFQRRTIVANNTIKNGSNATGSAIYLSDGAFGAVVIGNYIASNVGRGIYVRRTGGLGFTNYSEHILIANNVLESNTGDAQILAAGRKTLITGNLIFRTDSSGKGIWCEDADSDTTQVIEGNYVYGHAQDIVRTSSARAKLGRNWVTSGLKLGDRTEIATYLFTKADYAANGTGAENVRLPYDATIVGITSYTAATVASGSFNALMYKNGSADPTILLPHSSATNANGGVNTDDQATGYVKGDRISVGVANNVGPAAPGGAIEFTATVRFTITEANTLV